MRFVLLALMILFTMPGISQNRVGINEIQLTTSKGDQPAFEFFIPDINAPTVLDAWNKFHKPFKVKPKQDKNQRNYYFSDNATITELSENTIDIYARIYETGGGVRFACAFDLGGVFISSRKTSDKFSKAKLLLNKYYAEIAMDAIVAEIENELKALEAIKSEYDLINEEIASFENKAKTYSTNIEEAEEEETKVLDELTKKSADLTTHQNELNSIKAELKTIDKAGIVADLLSYTDNLKNNNLETTKIEKDVERKEAEIASLEVEINILKNDLDEKKAYSNELQVNITAIEDRLVELNIDEKEENAKLLERNINEIETIQSDLNLRKSSFKKTIAQEEVKLSKAKDAINISKETRAILEEKLKIQEAKLRELEELKATIE